MPNWCNNTVEISHPDKSRMEALVLAVNEGKFLNFARPVPESLSIVAGRVGDDEDQKQKDLVAQEEANLAAHGYRNWYDFCVNEWGTKWEVEAYNPVELEPNNRVTFGFDSAWAPPCGAMEYLVDAGYSVRLYYYEPGMCFCGVWEDGDDDFYELDGMNSAEIAEGIPSYLDEMFCISEQVAEYEAENQEIELNDGIDSINE